VANYLQVFLTIQQIYPDKKRTPEMETHSINSLAMQLEVDRATMQRALKNTPPDLVTGKRQSFKVSTAARALERHRAASGTGIPGNGRGNGSYASVRLNQIADELERLCREADEGTKLVASLPDLDAKQPHSRSTMVLINRISELFKESNALLLEREPTSMMHYVTDPIVGTMFRELLAAIYGRDVEIDGMQMFPEEHRHTAK
jgi:hypothetical protein